MLVYFPLIANDRYVWFYHGIYIFRAVIALLKQTNPKGRRVNLAGFSIQVVSKLPPKFKADLLMAAGRRRHHHNFPLMISRRSSFSCERQSANVYRPVSIGNAMKSYLLHVTQLQRYCSVWNGICQQRGKGLSDVPLIGEIKSQFTTEILQAFSRCSVLLCAALCASFSFARNNKRPCVSTIRINTQGLLSWSECRDSNPGPPAPKAGALPTAQHPVIYSLQRGTVHIIKETRDKCKGRKRIDRRKFPWYTIS